MIDERFVILGVLFSIIGQLSYIIDTIKGKIKPNRVTWFLWGVIPLIAFVAEINEGVGLISLLTFIVGFGPLLIFIASFVNKKAFWKIRKLDIFCGILSLIGLIFWSVTKNGNIAILFSVFADATAGIPTIIKAYLFPESENYKIYMFSVINAVITLLAIKNWNFANFAFPMYILLLCILMIVLVKFRLGIIISRQIRQD